MEKKIVFLSGVLFLMLVFASTGFTHTPLCSCYDNGDGTIVCEGGFSDGSSASGVVMKVVDKKGNVLFQGKMDEFSEYAFNKPKAEYKVIFDAGPGHVVEVSSKNITE